MRVFPLISTKINFRVLFNDSYFHTSLNHVRAIVRYASKFCNVISFRTTGGAFEPPLIKLRIRWKLIMIHDFDFSARWLCTTNTEISTKIINPFGFSDDLPLRMRSFPPIFWLVPTTHERSRENNLYPSQISEELVLTKMCTRIEECIQKAIYGSRNSVTFVV